MTVGSCRWLSMAAGRLVTRLIYLTAFALLATSIMAQEQAGSPELTEEASKAIDDGLTYLLKTQGKDGSWSSGKFQMASTSLGLMAFMVKGEFPGYGPNAEALDRAKNWLLKQAKSVSDGYLGKSMYEHGLATLALSEMWGMTKGENDDEDIQKALEAAVAVILRSQNVGGGWRYQPSPDAGQDTSVTVMVFIGLASARQAGIMVPDEAIKRLVSYLEGAQDQGSGGFSYAPTGKGVSIACSGGGLYAAQLCGERDSQMVKAAINYVSNLPDGTFASTGHYYYTHYYAIQSMVQSGDEYYAEWYPKIRDALIDKQSKDGAWNGAAGGPVQGTAMSILILGTPHRYIPVYQR
ncbi:MAG: terpene cyclase/mutase family protein [Verrucomicrobia bacterium]|jgi:hypothetical protein|nr:terpene cyclase/mutase family protein [Verrucomicrobiota bacterium]MBT7066633.1 terpene cyclase/mutase family protein [Verrucomicrobiota bacterium]MBT7700394.1 terpene cyclase/mutase family protein [Verrucomicrobiota bacterium]